MRRRQYFTTVCAIGTGALAGCLTDEESPSDTDSTDDADDEGSTGPQDSENGTDDSQTEEGTGPELSEEDQRFVDFAEEITAEAEWMAFEYEKVRTEYFSLVEELENEFDRFESTFEERGTEGIERKDFDSLIDHRDTIAEFVEENVYPHYLVEETNRELTEENLEPAIEAWELGDENRFETAVRNMRRGCTRGSDCLAGGLETPLSAYDDEVSDFSLQNPPLIRPASILGAGFEPTVIANLILGEYPDMRAQFIRVYSEGSSVFEAYLSDEPSQHIDPAGQYSGLDLSLLESSESIRVLCQIRETVEERNATFYEPEGAHQIIRYASEEQATSHYEEFTSEIGVDGHTTVGTIGEVDKIFWDDDGMNRYGYAKHLQEYVLLFDCGPNIWDEKYDSEDRTWIHADDRGEWREFSS